MDIRFNHLGYLHALWAVVVLALLVVWAIHRKRRALERFASSNLLGVLVPDLSRARQGIKAALVLLALTAAVFGMIDPRWGVYYEEVQRRGIDLIFALDVSRSMLAEDVSPNRLERAKQYIADVVEVLGGDRVGLVTFAGEAVVKCPLTTNYSAFRMVLDEVDVRSSPRGGTLIGDAIRLAAESFVDDIRGYKAIIVITDGEDHESYPVEAAKKAYDERGARVYAIGIGDPAQGARVPTLQDGQKVYMQHEGQEVWSKMNLDALQKIAMAGAGASIPAGTKQLDLGQYYLDRIATADQREFESTRVQQHRVQFHWFAGAAVLLLVVESILSERRAAMGASQGL